MRVHLAFACVVLAGGNFLRATDALPPRPTPVPHSAERGKSPEAIDHLRNEYRAAEKAWHDKLTPEQRTAWLSSLERSSRGSNKLPIPGENYDWHDQAKRRGLSEVEVAQLDRDKLLLEDLALRQSFEAYTAPRGPVFITSDSALNAFHVLFEDTFRELEIRRAFTLRTHLENVVTKVRELLADQHRNNFPLAELAPGWRHAQLVIGPALRLLGTPLDFFDAEAREEIERQVEKIRAADTVELPPWLAPQSRTLLAIDYRRCKPVGFYADTESLQNYFRGVRWLQSVPFRADRDDELTAIGLLGFAVMSDYRNDTQSFFRDYGTMLGRADDPALPEAAYESQNFLSFHRNRPDWKSALADKRHWLLRSHYESAEWKKLNDALRLPPDAAAKLSEIQFRVLPAYRLPESLALAKLAEPGRLPSGLAVAALLGSDFALRQLANLDPAKLDNALNAAREDWHPNKKNSRRAHPSLYDRYLETLAALHLPAEPDAPAFVRNDAWTAKSCLTTLASWAQMRHTFTLQAKQSIHYLGIVDTPPGFVEPNPEFFRRLADLVELAERNLDDGDAFLPNDDAAAELNPAGRRSTSRDRWSALKSVTRRLEALAHKQLRQQPWSSDEENFFRNYGEQLALVHGYFGNSWLTPRDDAPRWATVASDPSIDTMLAVAAGRARLIHVLYPYRGGEVLCTGAVMSYYEYPEKGRPLTDAEWKAKLDSANAPPLPAWIAPFLAR